MKVTRVIVYEGTDEWVESTLEHALREGKNAFFGEGKSVTVYSKEDYLDAHKDEILTHFKPFLDELEACAINDFIMGL